MSNIPPNSTSTTWNIPKGSDDLSRSQFTPMINQMMSLRNFSSYGGGDAPVTKSTPPKLRSSLFTISARSIVASQSQLNDNCSTSAINTNDNYDVEKMSDFTKHVNHDQSESENETKPINTSYVPTPTTTEVYKVHKPVSSPLKLKRCRHGSLDDLPKACSSTTSTNRRKSAPNTNPRGDILAAANNLLVEENKHLIHTMKLFKRKLLMTKAAAWFVLGALKRKQDDIEHVKELKFEKEQQCAARLILHSLLLNSWRNTKHELDTRLEDNAELRRSVENFTLQTQVLRHVQTNDKQKAQEKAILIQSLNEELTTTKEENKIMRNEVGIIEEELFRLQATSQNLIEENRVLSNEIKNIKQRRDALLQTMERERARSDQLEKEYHTMKENSKIMEAKLNEATEGQSHWQEKARCTESEVWELQFHLDTKATDFKNLTSTCDTLRSQNTQLTELKGQLETNIEQAQLDIHVANGKNKELQRAYETVQDERDELLHKEQDLQDKLDKTTKDYRQMQKEVMARKLQNVRRRREWGNALYFLVNPVDAIRRKLVQENFQKAISYS